MHRRLIGKYASVAVNSQAHRITRIVDFFMCQFNITWERLCASLIDMLCVSRAILYCSHVLLFHFFWKFILPTTITVFVATRNLG
jgi:hypothetical protein